MSLGRPEKPIDWAVVDSLLEAGCVGTEIAAHFDMHPQTFYSKVEEYTKTTFTHYSSEKRQKGDAMLKYAQFAKAIGLSKKGDTQLLTFLGKVRLDQQEHKESNTMPNDVSLNFADAFIKSEARRLELEKKLQQMEESVAQPQTDSVV